MSLRQYFEKTPLRSAPLQMPTPVILPVASTPPVETPRHNAQTVQQILALAAQLQTDYRNSSSSQEIEALGREISIDSMFVRRAQAQIEGEAKRIAVLEKEALVRQKHMEDMVFRPFGRRQARAAVFPALVYLLLTPLVFGLQNSIWVSLFFAVVPAFLALRYGYKNRAKFVGAVGGALLGIAAIAALLAKTYFNHSEMPYVWEFCGALSLWAGVGWLLGVSGAIWGQSLNGQEAKPEKKRLRLRVVMDTSDAPKEK